MFRTTLAAAVLALTSAVMPASAATIGNDAIDRAYSDNYSDFGLAFTGISFVEGTITSWRTFIERIDGGERAGSMGLLVLSDLGSGNYEVKGVDVRNVGTGLNEFTGTSIAAAAGDILGVFMADAKVSYDLINQPSGPDEYTSNGFLSDTPLVGDVIAFTRGSTDRTYSINATVAPVPLPATGLLLVGALGGITVLRRRKKS